MARSTLAVIGAIGVGRDLAALRDDVRQGLESLVAQSAVRVQQRAQARAPRDRGDLIRAIEARGRGLSWRVGITDASIPSRGGDHSHQNPYVYGVWYELGFQTRGIPAHPYMRPAADAEEPIFQDAATTLLAQAVP